MRYLLLVCTLIYGSLALGQTKDTTKPAQDRSRIFQFVEKMPQAPPNFLEYLGNNVRYPDKAKRKHIQGRVLVSFIVNEDGTISDVQVDSGIGGGCDEEAVRVISAMPNWKPGTQNGKPVKVLYRQPISFRLE